MNQIDLLPGGGLVISEPMELFFMGLKMLFVLGFLLYTIFSFVIIRQVVLMGNSYKTDLEIPLKLIAVAHFLVALAVFILSILFL